MKYYLSTLCKIFAWMSLIGGAIFGIWVGYKYGVTSNGFSRLSVDRNVGLTIIYTSTGIFIGFIQFVLFYAVSTILENQDDIIRNLKDIERNTVDVKKEVDYNNKKGVVKSNEWRCPECGKINPNYVGTCSCGHSK